MSSVYLLTGGTSALGPANLAAAAGLPMHDDAAKAASVAQAADALTPLRAWLKQHDGADLEDRALWSGSPINDVLASVGVVGPKQTGSAELDSLYHAPPAPPPDQADRIVLLASDSIDGLAAAVMNATLLGRPTRLHTDVPASGPQHDEDQVGTCHIVRVKGLWHRDPSGFEAAIGRIAGTMRWMVAGPAPDRVIAHLTGGFKAVIPYVATLLEFLPVVAEPASVPVLAYAKHEHAESAHVVTLRRADGGQTRAELQKLVDGLQPRTHHLESLAWYRREDGLGQQVVEQTPIGKGLIRMLGLRSAPPAGR